MLIRRDGDNVVANDEVMSPQEALIRNRVLCLYGVIVPYPMRYDNMSVTYVTDMLTCLADQSSDPVYLFIDSPGGLVSAGLTLYDTMKMLDIPIYTVSKSAASMATIILAAGEPGHRYVYPNSETMLHLPSGSMEGDAHDIDISAKQMKQTRNKLVDLLIENGVDKPRGKILKDIDRNYWMNAEETVDYGVADHLANVDLFKAIRGCA